MARNALIVLGNTGDRAYICQLFGSGSATRTRSFARLPLARSPGLATAAALRAFLRTPIRESRASGRGVAGGCRPTGSLAQQGEER